MDMQGFNHPSGSCRRILRGLGYTCPRCKAHYCFMCIYKADWRCPKCGDELL